MSKPTLPKVIRRSSRSLAAGFSLGLLLALSPTPVLAGAGHDHGESAFQKNTGQPQPFKVSPEMMERLGIKLETVSRRTLAVGLKLTGQIESQPNQKVNVTLPTGGTIKQLLVKTGDRVSAGQAVAVITSPELNSLRTESLDRQADAMAAIEQAKTDVRLAQQNYDKQQIIAQAEINEAQKAYDFAASRAEGDRALISQGALARRTGLESNSLMAQAQANLDRAKTKINVIEAQAGIDRAQTSLEAAERKASISGQTYQNRLRQLDTQPNDDGTITITAPISGTIAEQTSSQGESGQDAGKPILTILNGNGIQISANVFEKDLGQVRVGQSVRVKVASVPNKVFNAQITTVSPAVDSNAQVVPVKATITGDETVLKPGMFAELELMTDRSTAPVLAIPQSAIHETPDKKNLIFVQNGNQFEPVEVELGMKSGNWVEVKQGLFDGDKIATQRIPQLYAQSLRGGSGEAEAGHGAEHGEASTAPAKAAGMSLGNLGWLGLPIGLAGLGGMFAAGMVLERRRSRTLQPASVAVEAPHPQVVDGIGGTPVLPFVRPHHDHPQHSYSQSSQSENQEEA